MKMNGVVTAILVSLLFPLGASAQAPGKKVNVDNLKKQYWSQEADLDVVQNRLYSKKGKFDFQILSGIMNGDPFTDSFPLGGSLGYHFNEKWSAHLLGWGIFSGPSPDFEELRENTGAIANTNEPYWYVGGEAAWSLIYGKLSLAGSSILYYDAHLLGGAGVTGTETGTNFSMHIGIGQQIYLTQGIALRIDYRLMYYNEIIREKREVSTQGDVLTERANFPSVVTLGVDFLF